MAYIFLLIALITAIVAGWQGWSGWDEAAATNTQWLLALKVAVLAGIPYIAARALSEIVGLHQRQQIIELLGRQLQLTAMLAEREQPPKITMPPVRPAAPATAPASPAAAQPERPGDAG